MNNFFNRNILRTFSYQDDSALKTIEFLDANGERRSITVTETMYNMAEWMLLNMIHDGYLQFVKKSGIVVAEILVEKTLIMPENELLDVSPMPVDLP